MKPRFPQMVNMLELRFGKGWAAPSRRNAAKKRTIRRRRTRIGAMASMDELRSGSLSLHR